MSSSQPSILLNLINLSRRARKAEDALALQFIVVNETFALAPYVIASLWVRGEGVVSISAVSQVDRQSAFAIWLDGLCQHFSAQYSTPVRIDPATLSSQDQAEWRQALPTYVLWVPSGAGENEHVCGLLFGRNEPWKEEEIAVIAEWVDIWRYAWQKLHAPSLQSHAVRWWSSVLRWVPTAQKIRSFVQDVMAGLSYFASHPVKAMRAGKDGFSFRALWADKRKRYTWLAVLVMFFPVRLTVLAPAQLVPANPAVIRVPIDGVVGEFFVAPNQRVNAGDPLFALDLTALTAKLQIAEQETKVASAELRQSTLQSLSDQKSRRLIAPQEGKAMERRLEAEYLKSLLEKAQIKAPRAGVALFDDPSEWIGRPVAAGERVMVVATEGEVEIEAWIPISDAIDLANDAPVTLYLSATPLSPVEGQLRYLGHEALQRPDGSYAYRLRASILPEDTARRVGLKGTVRVSGSYVPLSYWVLRKPIAWVRQFLGI